MSLSKQVKLLTSFYIKNLKRPFSNANRRDSIVNHKHCLNSFANTNLRFFHSRKKEVALLISAIVFFGGTAVAQEPVTATTLVNSPATQTTVGSELWGTNGSGGVGTDSFITGVTALGNTYSFTNYNSTLTLVREDNTTSSGTRCGVFAERFNNTKYLPSYPTDSNGDCSMETALLEPIVNRGALDIFHNVTVFSQWGNNIERVDVILQTPLTAPTNSSDLDKVGFLASEKNGNNEYKAAAVLSVDGSGKPLTFGPLTYLDGTNNDYGEPNSSIDWRFMQTAANPPHGLPVGYTGTTEKAGYTLFTLDNLGVSESQKVYGISFFGKDVTASYNLLDTASFPKDTKEGADIHGGLGSVFLADIIKKIEANDSHLASIDEVTGGNTANVVTNDLLNGVVNPTIGTNIGDVTLNSTGTAQDGTTTLGLGTTPAAGSITMNPDGTITVAPNTTAGTYQYTYEICEATNLTNCDTGVATVQILATNNTGQFNVNGCAFVEDMDGSYPTFNSIAAYAKGTTGPYYQNFNVNSAHVSQSGDVVVGSNIITSDASGSGKFLFNNTGKNASNYGTMYETVIAPTVIPNRTYRLTFKLAGHHLVNPARILPSVNGTPLGSTSSPTGTGNWQAFDYFWVAGAATTAQIKIDNLRATDAGNDFGFDGLELCVLPLLDAVDDASTTIDSAAGGSIPNVVTNDTLSGVANPTIGTNPGDVTLQTSGTAQDGTTTLGLDTTPAAGSITMNPDGTITVAPNTTAGTYQYTYEICEVTHPVNCDTAVATVVILPPIDATDDTPAAINSTTGGSTANVVANDTFNGVTNPTIGTNPGDVTLQTSGTAQDGTTTLGLDTTPAAGSITMNPDGTITVAPNTTAGTYQYTYEICEVTNPTNCDTAVATVVVDPAPIDAINDAPAAINSTTGGSTANVVANDTLNGVTNPTIGTNPGDVTLNTSGTAEDGITVLGLDRSPSIGSITMNPDGTITVAPNTTPSVYQYTYEICEVNNPTNCDVAVVTLLVENTTSAPIAHGCSVLPGTVTGTNTGTVTNGALSMNYSITKDVQSGYSSDSYIARPHGLEIVNGSLHSNGNDVFGYTLDITNVPANYSPIIRVLQNRGLTLGNNEASDWVLSWTGGVGNALYSDSITPNSSIYKDGAPTAFDVANREILGLSTSGGIVNGGIFNTYATNNATTEWYVEMPVGATNVSFVKTAFAGWNMANPTCTAINQDPACGVNSKYPMFGEDASIGAPGETFKEWVTFAIDFARCIAIIDAIDDDFTGTPVNGGSGGTTASVVTADTLDAVANPTIGTNPGDVTLQTSGTAQDGTTTLGLDTTPTAGSITMNPDGTITVAPNTTAGTYEYTYEICEVTNPTNCDTAVATVVVDPAPIDAIDDAPAAINSTTGGSTPNVVANDTLNGVTNPTIGTNPGDVTLQTSGTAQDGTTTLGLDTTPAIGSITMNPDGTITVAPNTTAGTYEYTYEICEVTNPTNCDTAVATVVVSPPISTNPLTLPSSCGAFNTQGWLTTAMGTESSLTFGSNNTNDPYAVLPIWRDGDGRIQSAFGTPDESLAGTIPSSAGTNLISTLSSDANHQSEYHETVFRLYGSSGTTESFNILTTNAHEYTAYWIENSNGDVIGSSDFAYTTTNGVGPDLPVSITFPSDGIAYLYVAMFDSTVSYGRPKIDYACAIKAIDDDFSAAPINSTAGGTTTSIIVQDTLSGASATIGTNPGDVTLQTSGTAQDGTTTLGLDTTPAAGSITMNPDGTITVAPNTTAGTYQYTYEICEVTNPTNCDTAVATVVVDPAPIDAIDDAPAAINSTTGGSTANVVANDTLNGVTNPTIGTNPGDVTLQTSGTAQDGTTTLGLDTTPTAGSITMNPDGTITVAPNTTAGTYQYTYEICEVTNPTNCDTAVATVVVDPAPIDAIDDAPAAINSTTGGSTPNVVANDTLNGVTNPTIGTNPGDVTLQTSGTAQDGTTTLGLDTTPTAGSITMNPDGTITVAPNTTAGTYQYTYEICEVTNPTNCDTAVATVVVDPAPIDAIDDAPAAINSTTGGSTPNVVANDTLNGVTNPTIGTNPGDVTLQTSGTAQDGTTTLGLDTTPTAGSITMNPDGTITVAPNTTAGTYQYTYEICEVTNPTNCDTAVATVVVDPAPIDAIDDAPAAINSTTGGSTPNVVANDTLNGVTNPTIGTNPGDVTLQTSGTAEDGTTTLGLDTTPAAGSITMNPDGTITVAPNTTAGTYEYTYEICEVTNPTNCDTAVATVVVDPAPIDAIDDAPAAINSTTGGSTPNVVANDTLNGVTNPTIGTNPGDVTLQTSGTAQDGTTTLGLDTTPTIGSITMNPDGTITVAPNTTAGTYEYTYEICEVTNPTNCDTAVATVVVDPAPIDAIDDAPAAINSTTGGSTPNVVANDTLNGVTNPTIGTNPGDVTLQTSGTAEDGTTTLGLDTTPAIGSITMNPDGTITVAPNTTAGTYQYTYEICEVTNPTNCDTAVATVVVDPAPIDAIDDAPAAINSTTGGSTPNVVANDTLNGVTNPTIGTNPGDVTLQTSGTAQDGTTTLGLDTTPTIGSITMNPDGTITVAPNTTAGTYQYTYEICEVTNPTNCDTAVATVVVDPAPIDAIDDAPAAINSTTGGSTPNVVANDTLNGVTNPTIGTNPGDVTLQTSGTAEDGTTTLGLDTTPAAGSITMNPDGTITVAPNTTAGIYEYTYEICEVTNPTNCDTAVATVVVDPAPIEAVDVSAATPINGVDGGTITENVLTNDTLNGVAVDPSDVTLVPVTDGPLTVNADGSVTVAPNTPAGTYTVTYEICEVLNPSNCDSAEVTVPVGVAPIDAVDVSAATPINGVDGGTITENVLTNDTLNGVAVDPSDVTLVPVTDGPLTVNADGSVTVAPNTPAGTYTVTYEICEVLNPSNCDSAEVTVPVGVAPIDAVDVSAATPINGVDGGTITENVLTNDTLNGVAVDPSDVTLVPVTDGPLTVNADGSVTVAPNTPAGTYTVTYEICEVLNPSNCDSAEVTVPVGVAPIEAVDVSAATPINGVDGGTITENVLTNDTLNGVAVDPSDVTLVPVTDGPLTVNADGSVTVAPNTPAGTYTVTYEICEVLNPSNCDSAEVTVPVGVAPIDAVDVSAATPINGVDGGTITENVLTNDTLNGVAVDPSDVTLVPVTDGPLTVNADGSVTVAPNTPAGTYTVTYEICEVLNPSNCDSAEVTVPVGVAPIDAVDVSAATPINGVDGGTITENVLTNDTLNGVAVDPSDVTLVPVTDGPLTVNADGSVTVAPNTPAGTYTVTYEICEVLNPSNCDSAEVTVPVGVAPIDAVDVSAATPINGVDGGTITENVLTNDTLNGVAVDPSDVTLVPVTDGPLTVNADGSVTVAPNTPAGTYTVTYEICEVLNPSNCDSAEVTVPVGVAPIDAVDVSAATPINGVDGGTITENVLTNDTLNGVAVDPSDVTLVPVTDGPLTVNADGSVTVAPNTPAGTYTVTYEICEVLNPSNCDSAEVTVPVGVAPIDAVDVSAATPINGVDGGTITENVLTNDTLNGVAVDPSDVTLVPVTDGPLTVNADGSVTVAPNTPAGTYTVTYQICEVLNPSNCDTAEVTVPVGVAPIDAVDVSAATPINGVDGGTITENVLTNDTLNGVAVDPSDVTLVPVTDGPLTVNADGSVTVAPNTPAGTYTVTYEICEVLNPSNCDSAEVTVPVEVAPIEAVDVSAATPINGVDGGTITENVLTNDTLNGVAVDPSDVTLVPVTDGPLTVNADGSVTVAPNTPAGTYTVTYEICEVLNPSNCDTAEVTVPVLFNLPPVTENDSASDQTLGQAVTINPLANDTDSENNLDPTTVMLKDPAGNPVKTLVVEGEGTWVVDPVTGLVTFTPETGYVGDPTPVSYTVKDTLGLESTPATITIDYEDPAALTGTVWLDRDKDGVIDSDEDRKVGWTLNIKDSAGNIVATTETDSQGNYSVTGLIPDAYTVEFINTNGTLIATQSTPGVLSEGQTLDLPLPVDPSGLVYDSVSRNPVEGVTLQLLNSQGTPIDAACLGQGQQNQVTGADGFYAFDVLPDAHASCPTSDTYRINVVAAPAGYFTDSEVIPAQLGVFDSDANEANCTVNAIANSNSCEVQAQPDAPQGNQATTYYMDFLLSAGDTDVIFNHLPIDLQLSRQLEPGNVVLRKVVNKKQVSVGDQLYYSITAENTLSRDIIVDVSDDLPTGFKLISTKVKVIRAGADGILGNNDDAVSTENVTGTDPVRFEDITLGAGETIRLGYLVKVGTGATQGNAVNKAQAFKSDDLNNIASNLATASVQVIADSALDQSTLIGKVFHDRDGDGYQDPANVTGVTVKSDYFGWNSLHLGGLNGRVSVLDNPEKHRKIVRMPVSNKNAFKITTQQGTVISVNNAGQVTEQHVGLKAKGLTAQDIRVTTRRIYGMPTQTPVKAKRVPQVQTQVLEITITNHGINEEGIPGVRLATVGGLLIETDGFGRYHIPDVDGGRRSMGKNFILKVDPATLPQGARFTTENPRVLRITGAALNKINFGVKLPVQHTPQRTIQQKAQYETQQRQRTISKQVPVYKTVDVGLGSIFFNKNEHTIRADQRGNMDLLVAKIKRYGKGHIKIDAYTDSRHNAKYNIGLAQRRANTIRQELQRQLGSSLMRHVKVEVDRSGYKEVPHNDKRSIDYQK